MPILAGSFWSLAAAGPPGDAREPWEPNPGRLATRATVPRPVGGSNDAWQDALDEALLNQLLFGNLRLEDLSPETAGELVTAARRWVERQQDRLERMRQMAREGVLPRNALEPAEQELKRREKILQLALERARLFDELMEAARVEKQWSEGHGAGSGSAVPWPDGADPGAGWFRQMADAYRQRFGRELPVSAWGMTRAHASLGLDHRNRIDVAVHPDSPEGQWLQHYLRARGIPFLTFRGPRAGASTGAHVHIGPPSPALAERGGD